MFPNLVQLKNHLPSPTIGALSLIPSLALPIFLKRVAPSLPPTTRRTLSYVATFALLQYHSQTTVIRLIFNIAITAFVCEIGMRLANTWKPSPKKPNPQPVETKQQPQPSIASSSHSQVRYRALPDDQKLKQQKSFYEALYSVVSSKVCKNPNNPKFKIPYLKGYNGEEISVTTEANRLIIIGGERENFQNQQVNDWQIHLFPGGNYEYFVPYPQLKVTNGERYEITSNTFYTQKDEKGVDTFYAKSGKDDPIPLTFSNPLDHAQSAMEFLIFKQKQIVNSLGELNWRCIFVDLYACLRAILMSAQTPVANNSTSQALISPLSIGSSQSKTIGPIWSPVAASQDSTFLWKVTKDDQENISVEFEKNLSGRGRQGGSESKRLRFQQDAKQKHLIFVHVEKKHENDVSSSSRQVSYQIEMENRSLQIHSLNTNVSYSSSKAGGSFKDSNDTPAPDQIARDIELIVSSLITIRDIFWISPESVILDVQSRQACRLNGTPVSPEEIQKQVSTYPQGSIGTVSHDVVEFIQACNHHKNQPIQKS